MNEKNKVKMNDEIKLLHEKMDDVLSTTTKLRFEIDNITDRQSEIMVSISSINQTLLSRDSKLDSMTRMVIVILFCMTAYHIVYNVIGYVGALLLYVCKFIGW